MDYLNVLHTVRDTLLESINSYRVVVDVLYFSQPSWVDRLRDPNYRRHLGLVSLTKLLKPVLFVTVQGLYWHKVEEYKITDPETISVGICSLLLTHNQISGPTVSTQPSSSAPLMTNPNFTALFIPISPLALLDSSLTWFTSPTIKWILAPLYNIAPPFLPNCYGTWLINRLRSVNGKMFSPWTA